MRDNRRTVAMWLLLAVSATAWAAGGLSGGGGGTSVTGTPPVVVTNGAISVPCAGAGQSGLLCQAGTGPLTIDGGLVSIVPSGGAAFQMVTGANLCLKSGGLNCISSDGTAPSLNSARLDGNGVNSYISLDVNSGSSINYGNTSISVDSASATIAAAVGDGASAYAMQVRTSSTLSTPGSVMIKVVNNGTTTGVIDAPSGFYGVIPVADGGAVELTTVVRAPTPSTPKAEEYGVAALSGAAATVTFNTPFASAPVCFCNHISATPIACGPTGAASAASVVLAVTAGTGNINWRCIGAR